MVTTNFATLPDGFQYLSLFDQALALCAGYTDIRTRLTVPITLYVNGNAFSANCNGQTAKAGSDTNNGLSVATPFLTLQHAFNVVQNFYDAAGFAVTIQLTDAVAGSAGAANYTGNLAGPLVGPGSQIGIIVQGNVSSSTNVNVTAPNGTNGISANDYATLFLRNLQINDAGSATSAIFTVEFAIIDVQGVTFGSFNNAANVLHANKYGVINLNTAGNTIAGGGSNSFMFAEFGGIIQARGQTIAIPTAVAFTTFAIGQNCGQFLGFTSSTFTGLGVAGTTGIRAALSTGATLSTNPASPVSINSVFPGNANATMTGFANDDFGDPQTNSILAITGIGYPVGVGAGSTITQITSKSTAVTLNTPSGEITMNNAALSATTIVSFSMTNTSIAGSDIMVLNHVSGGTPGSYTLNAQCASGGATINVRNNTAGTLSEAIVLGYVIIKGAIT